ncbi:MAG: 3-phosphoserine/phosphohydroxythreonine transaminase [Cytophagales bacterium]|nr:3-phosphoserine/phosphohydroxythreonine transaminase [Cytophagales bacterium]
MSRVFNFSAGPAALPETVLAQAAAEMLDWRGTGMSVMEMSHRGSDFMGIHAEALADLRALLAVPSHYKILFLQGGGLGENAIVPLNLMRGQSGHQNEADIVITGVWSEKSYQEAQRYGQMNIAASAVDSGFTQVPAPESWKLHQDSAYLHLCTNETINGVEYHFTPNLEATHGKAFKDRPIVADMSSHILSRPVDVSQYGLIYGGAQKNIGPAGLTIAIVREDLLVNDAGESRAHPLCPSVFNYQVQAESDSMYNTPPTYGIYIAGLVFKWLKAQGGLAAMERQNRAKAALLYDYLDTSSFYENRVRKADRSLMNVPFFLKDESLNAVFLQGANERGLKQLKGHRVVGGMRASLYNAMPLEGVQALVAYLKEFERVH